METSLISRLHSFGAAEVIVNRDGRFTYADLLAQVEHWRQSLDQAGVGQGEVVMLEGPASPAACAALLALIERNVIVVPLAPLPAAKTTEFREIAEAERVITLTSGEIRSTGVTANHALYEELRGSGAPGLVLFSSGTTGRSKATVLNFEKVLARYGPPTKPQRTLAFLNLDHIGGINTLLHTISQGGCLITIPERTAATVCSAIEEFQVQVLPTTPTFLNMLLISGAHRRFDLRSLRLITYGTEPMPLGTLQRLHDVLPDVRLKQTYGLSELGILPTRSRSNDTLWVKLGGPGFEYEIREGVLWIRSEMAMLGYLNAPAPFDAEGFFNTQDAVEVDGDYVRILGRKSEIINVAGEKVYPSEVEDVLLDHPDIAEATVSGRPSPVTGMVVKAVVKTVAPIPDQRDLVQRIRAHCASRLESFKVPVIVEISDEDHHNDRFKKSRALG